jgi:hypothetical protein
MLPVPSVFPHIEAVTFTTQASPTGHCYPGDVITVNGTGFGSGSSSSVIFGNATMAVVSWLNTEIIVVVPQFATTGKLKVLEKG